MNEQLCSNKTVYIDTEFAFHMNFICHEVIFFCVMLISFKTELKFKMNEAIDLFMDTPRPKKPVGLLDFARGLQFANQ